MSGRQTIRPVLLAAGLLLLAYALRVFRLDSQSIWWDEGISLHLGTSGLAAITRDRLSNIHPPLYFYMLKGWLALAGVSAFTGRYLSVLASLAQVALIMAAARDWAGRTDYLTRRERLLGGYGVLPWIAGALILIAPLSVIYGQEIRVYAMLPVAYLAILLTASRILGRDRPRARLFLLLAIAEWAALHLHYVMVFGVALVGAWGLIALARRRAWAEWRGWLMAQIAVVVLSLPWFLAVLVNRAAVQAEANAGTFAAEAVPVPFLFAQVWVFHWTGLAGALASRPVQAAAVLGAVSALALFTWRVARPAALVSSDPEVRRLSQRQSVLRLAAIWGIPLACGLAVWSVRSFSHPRYIMAYAVCFVPLAAFLLAPARRAPERALSSLLAVCMVSLSLWGLRQYFFVPSAAKPDMRSVASYLESVASPDDVILVPDTDWSLPFEYHGPARIAMPGMDQLSSAGGALDETLDCAADDTHAPECRPPARVFAVEYPNGTRDWQARLPFELERRGYRTARTSFDDLRVVEYRRAQTPSPLPACATASDAGPEAIAADFDGLRLRSAWVEQDAAADTAVAVALCWESVARTVDDLAVSLTLSDPLTGERVAQADSRLVNASGAPSSRWAPGDSVVSYHVLPLWPGVPPVPVKLTASVYAQNAASVRLIDARGADGETRPQVTLGQVSLGPPAGRRAGVYDVAEPPRWAQPVEMAPGLTFLGTYGLPATASPGQSIRVPLYWQATAGNLADLRPALQLEQEGDVLAQVVDAPAQGRYPTDRWPVGQTVLEFRDLRLPAEAEGDVTLALELDGRRLELGQLRVEAGDLLFAAPEMSGRADALFGDAIRLAGFELAGTEATPPAPLDLKLLWRSDGGAIPAAYTVFAHVLGSDGRLIAQHDGMPAAGRRPTDAWLPGEYVIDPHRLTWLEADYRGPATIQVGLYDAATGARLTTGDGFDHFVLPVDLEVVDAGP